jgi:sigma-E factor negative regulatory protein RseC
MILETATITSVEKDALWVEAVQKSACETCTAQKGCGTAVLSKLTGRTSRLRVLKSQQLKQTYSVGQQVTIAIPEDVVVLASVCAYLLPLVTSLIGVWLLGSNDVYSAVGAILGLAIGGGLVSLYTAKFRDDPRFNPVLFQTDMAH